MAIPISASFGPDAVSEVIALTGGNPQRMAQLGASRPEFKPALAVLHLIKQQAGAPPMPTQSIAQQAMNPPPPQNPGATGLGAINVPKGPPMGQMPGQMPGQPPGQPPMQMAAAAPPMPQMAGGGLLALDNSAFDEQSFSGGGIVAFAGGGDSKAERRKALMRIIRTAETSDQRMAARMELNAMDGMDPGRTPGRGLADALAYTRDDLPFRQPVSADASIYSPGAGKFEGGDEPINAGPRARVPQSADASIYNPGGGGADFSGLGGDPNIFRSEMAKMKERVPSFAERTAGNKEPLVDLSKFRTPQNVGDEPINAGPRARSPQSADASIYNPEGAGISAGFNSMGSALSNMFSGKDKPPAGKPYAQKLLDAAGEFERKASNDEYSQSKKDYYSSQARSLREKAQQQGDNVQRNKETAGKYNEPAWSARARAINQSAPTLSASDQLKAFPGYEYFGMNKKDIAERDSRVGPVKDKIKAIDDNMRAARLPSAGAAPFSLDSYQPKQYGFNDAMRQKVEGGLGVIAPRAERGAPPSGSRTAPPPPTRKSDTPFIDTALRTSRTPPGVKDNPDQTDETLDSILAKRKGYMGPDVNYKGTSAEDKDARRQEDLWSMLAQIGFNTMAGTSQFGLENVGKGAAAAMPAMQEAMKNRRADDREDRKLEFESLLSQRKERGEGFDSSMREFGRLDDKKQALTIAQMNDKTNRAQIAAGERNALLMTNKQTDQGDIAAGLASKDPAVRAIWKQILDSKKYYDPNRDERSDEALIGQKRIRIEGEIKNVQGDRSKPIAQRNAEVAVLRQQLSDLSKPGANNVDPLVAKYLK